MSDESGRSQSALSRLAFFVAVVALSGLSLLALTAIGNRLLEIRLIQSLDSVADSFVDNVEASLDFGLPINGPGGVEEALQPPDGLSTGPDALTLTLDKLTSGDASKAPIPRETRLTGEHAVVAERAVLDSHGEVSAWLVLKRSTVGIDHVSELRGLVLAVCLAVFAAAIGLLLFFLKPSRILLLPAIVFLPAAMALSASFGLQSTSIARQVAVLAVADTGSDLGRAEQLGISFGNLVGMQDYLKQQVGTNPAIDRIEVKGPGGVLYNAGTETLGSSVAEMLAALPFSGFVDLTVGHVVSEEISVQATANIQPILADLSVLLLAAFVLWFCCGALLQGVWGEKVRHDRMSAGAFVAPALFFLLLFLSSLGSPGVSGIAPAMGFAALAAAFAVGLLVPARLVAPALVVGTLGAFYGLFGNGAALLLGAGLVAGTGYAATGLHLRPLHLAAALLPSIGLLWVTYLQLMPGVPLGAILCVAFTLVLAVLAGFGRMGRPTASRFIALPVAAMLGGAWMWVCLFVMQCAGFLLLAIAAGHVGADGREPSLASAYLLLGVVLYIGGNLVAGLMGRAARLRWILFEASVLAVVLLVGTAYVGNGDLALNTALAAALMGAIARWSAELPFLAARNRLSGALATAIELLGLVTALAIVGWLSAPASVALPATLTYLVMLSPLAFAMIAGIRTQPRRSAEEAGHGA